MTTFEEFERLYDQAQLEALQWVRAALLRNPAFLDKELQAELSGESA